MRGIHDSDMAGGGTPREQAQRLNQIIKDQRQLLHDHVNEDLTKVPQIFCPYKEVLTLYQLGAVPPPDVTLVWADDNYGYIRQLATPEEQQQRERPNGGGFGVYYHISYWGRPHDYLWLCTTPPSLVWEELSKAFDSDARNLWVINVGDLKPAEINITLAMTMAYDIQRYSLTNIRQYLRDFARNTFGPEHDTQIADILNQYYHLNYQRKPEHLGFNTSQNPASPIQTTEFSNEEIATRLAAFDSLVAETNKIYDTLPPSQRDAFYELVAYPVRASALQNQTLLYADLNRRAATPSDAHAAAEKSKAAYDAIQTETAYFNKTLAGGKWNRIMSSSPHNTDVFKLPKFSTGPTTSTPADQSTPHAASTEIPPSGITGFVEKDGYLSIAAEHFTRKIDRTTAAWQVIPGLGRLGDSIAIFPTTTPSITNPQDFPTTSPALEYDFHTLTPNEKAILTVQAIPTHRLNPERGLRYAVAIDHESPQIVDLESPENSTLWATNVLRGSAYGTTKHALHPGAHTLHLYMIDPGVILDHLTIDLGGLKKSYLPPPETFTH